jgi:hypothetical protein
MALAQMTDDWLREIDNKKTVGAALLDFSAAFDIIDNGKRYVMALQPLLYCGLRVTYLT